MYVCISWVRTCVLGSEGSLVVVAYTTVSPMPSVTGAVGEVPNGWQCASVGGGRDVGFPCIVLLVAWLHHALSVFQRLRDSLGSAALASHLSGHSFSSWLHGTLGLPLACKMRLSWRTADMFPLVLAGIHRCPSLPASSLVPCFC